MTDAEAAYWLEGIEQNLKRWPLAHARLCKEWELVCRERREARAKRQADMDAMARNARFAA